MKHLSLHNIYFRATLERFNKRKKDEGKSVSHINSVTNHSKEFLFFLESQSVINLNEIKQLHIDAYFEYLHKRKNFRKVGGLSNAYLEKHREAVLRFMEFVKGVDIGQTNFFISKFEKQEIPRDILTQEEMKLLFELCDYTINGIRNRAILSLLYGCGLRKGELYLLNVEDIDMSKEVIRIRHSKTAHQRDVPMAPQVKLNLEAYLYNVRELLIPEYTQEFAFLLNNQGKRMTLYGIQHKVNWMAKASGIEKPITAHRLRHAIATHLLGDFTIEEIALFLGHRNIDSSQIYTHLKYTKEPNFL